MAQRLRGMGHPHYANGFCLATHEDTLEAPLHWAKPRLVFVNSMGDLFHADVAEAFIGRVFETMRRAHWHIFQVLTKRSRRLREVAGKLCWPSNVWMGVTVESADYASRIADLRAAPAAVRFVSFEPLLGPVDGVGLEGLDWVIAGGESGPHARPLCAEWVRELRQQCQSAGIPFFFKQWGGPKRKQAGRLLDGRTWDEYPADLAHATGASG
jgi:protein gp37